MARGYWANILSISCRLPATCFKFHFEQQFFQRVVVLLLASGYSKDFGGFARKFFHYECFISSKYIEQSVAPTANG
jgi:hypothetical protein